MRIEVTQEDIDRGLKSSCYECPIAYAYKRKVKNKIRLGFSVGTEYIDHFVGESQDRYMLPKEAKKFIRRFDQDQPVRPFSFEIKKLKK